MREIEADGFITREEDISQKKRTCFNCRFYQYSLFMKRYLCTQGHLVGESDWRQKYSVCDSWRRIG